MPDLKDLPTKAPTKHSEQDTLVKPDMQAVLTRTYISADLHGFLLPILEAVSNSMHSIEARYKDKSSIEGHIAIALRSPQDPSNLLVSITDNGVGLTEENYGSYIRA